MDYLYPCAQCHDLSELLYKYLVPFFWHPVISCASSKEITKHKHIGDECSSKSKLIILFSEQTQWKPDKNKTVVV